MVRCLISELGSRSSVLLVSSEQQHISLREAVAVVLAAAVAQHVRLPQTVKLVIPNLDMLIGRGSVE